MPLGGFSKDKLVFDPTVPIESDNIGAYVRAGNDGTQISWTANVEVPASLVMQDITYSAACTDFNAGNSITVAYVSQGPALNQPLSISVVGPVITVSLATDGAGADSSTATQIAAAINANLAAAELVSASVSGVGATIQAPQVATSLSGGTLKQALDVHNMGSPHNGQFHEDCQHTSGDKGQFILGVRHDADTSMVSHDGDYAPLQLDENGNLKVIADLDVNFDYVYAEDSGHNSGDLGAYVLTVRQDTLAVSTDADGDYQSFKTDSLGRLWVTANVDGGDVADDDPDSGNPIKVGTRAVSGGPLALISADNDRADMISDRYRRLYVNNGSNIAIKNSNLGVDNIGPAVATPGAALAGRRTIMIQNLSNKQVYIGKDASITPTDSFVLAARATISLDIGQDVSVFVLGSDASAQDLRILELA